MYFFCKPKYNVTSKRKHTVIQGILKNKKNKEVHVFDLIKKGQNRERERKKRIILWDDFNRFTYLAQ